MLELLAPRSLFAIALVALAPACGQTAPGADAALDAATNDATPPPDDTPAPDASFADASDGDAAGDDGGGAECPRSSASGPDIVVTDRGALRGTVQGAVVAFKGVPYAAPPVGALRWRPPAPAACFDGVRAATDFGPACAQLDATGAPMGSEDCLTLNVWTPSTRDASSPLPVLFFIHGGGNYQGSASQMTAMGARLYDGAYLAEHGPAVVVTINYRLGPFGFLGHPGLTAESAQHSSGNYGLLDQLAALAWVRRNAAAFGGDPARLMVFGESAGGVDTCALLASPLAAGLFSRALIESGGCTSVPLATVESGGAMLAQNTMCAAAADPLACLRGLDTAAVLRGLPGSTALGINNTGYHYELAVDGWVLPEAPAARIMAGRHNHVPVVIGTNRDEYALFFPPTGGRGAMTDAQYQARVMMDFPAAGAANVLTLYPSAMYPSPYFAYVDVYSDAVFTCGARRTARALAGTMSEPVRRYFFTHVEPGLAAAYGAAHAFELPYVFHAFVAPSAEQDALSRAMVGYWTRFAATGDPNGAGAPAWPAYDAASDQTMVLDTSIAAMAGVRATQCNAWDMVAR